MKLLRPRTIQKGTTHKGKARQGSTQGASLAHSPPPAPPLPGRLTDSWMVVMTVMVSAVANPCSVHGAENLVTLTCGGSPKGQSWALEQSASLALAPAGKRTHYLEAGSPWAQTPRMRRLSPTDLTRA